jgi:hypothetical protein
MLRRDVGGSLQDAIKQWFARAAAPKSNAGCAGNASAPLAVVTEPVGARGRRSWVRTPECPRPLQNSATSPRTCRPSMTGLAQQKARSSHGPFRSSASTRINGWSRLVPMGSRCWLHNYAQGIATAARANSRRNRTDVRQPGGGVVGAATEISTKVVWQSVSASFRKGIRHARADPSFSMSDPASSPALGSRCPKVQHNP